MYNLGVNTVQIQYRSAVVAIKLRPSDSFVPFLSIVKIKPYILCIYTSSKRSNVR